MVMTDENLPRAFGKYHLIEQVATGGMAQLYRGKLYGAGGFEKDLAVKKILPHLVQDEAFVQMFMDEAMITVTLNHGNIAQVLDFGELDGEFFLVMEYIDGVDLQSLIKRSAEEYSPIPVQMAAHIVHEICRGLDYAHNKLGPDGLPLQIVHRDVSPQNVLLSFEGQVKLVDFGIARAASRITSTQAGVVKGKVAYMSPEQLIGQDVDHRSDVFAAGIILYELLTHQRPFEGATPQETMAQITRGVFKPPQKLNRHVHRKLAAVVKKALERNPKKRYQSAGKMGAGLAAYLHSVGEPPSPLALARLVRERLPDARPRTLQPTPVRAMRRDPTQPDGQRRLSTPPPAEPAEARFSAPAAEANPDKPRRRTTAPNFPTVSSGGSGAKPIEVSEQQPVMVGSDGEAISFGALGLPGDYLLEDSASRRPTDPELPRQGGNGPTGTAALAEAAQTEAELLTAATRLLTLAPVPDLSARFGSTADEEPTMVVPEKARPAAGPVEAPPPAAEPDEPEDWGDSLLAAPTRLLTARAALESQAPIQPASGGPAKVEVSDQFNAWMEADAREPEPDFDDEEPGRARKQPASKAWLMGVIALAAAGAVAAVWFLDPFGQPAPRQDGPELASLQPPGLPTAPGHEAPGEPEPTPPAGPDGGAPPPDLVAPDNGPGQPDPAAEPEAIALQPVGPDPGTPDQALPVADPPTKAPPKKPLPRPKRRQRLPKAVEKPAQPPAEVALVKGSGTLRINSEPFSVVFLGNRKIGPTPQMEVRLPAGSHTLTLRNESLGIEKRVRVRIEPDKVHTVFVELTE